MVIKTTFTLKVCENICYLKPREDTQRTCEHLSGYQDGVSGPELGMLKYRFRISLPLSSLNLLLYIFLTPGLTLQLEMPYIVCPNGLIRVLSETPPPFLTAPEVSASPVSLP